MTFRVSVKMLEARVSELNELTGNPPAPWTRDGAKLRANVGCYYLDQSYGGVNLAQMVNESGGISTPLGDVRHTKGEMLEILNAAIWGIRTGKGA